MKEILNLFLGTSISMLILVSIIIFVAIILPDIIENNIDDKKEQKEWEDGIERRWVTTGYAFYVYTIYKNEKYYLNKDGNFYTSTTNIKVYLFNHEQDMEKYINLHEKEFHEKYPNIKIQKYKRREYIGKCKKLELGE